MTQYRRSLTPGSTYFFTVNLANRSGALLPYSSIHRFIERGDLPRDWACACEEIGMGERA